MDLSTALALLQATVAQAPETALSGGDFRVAVVVAAAAFAIAFGVIGAALSQGFATARACESIARNPQAAGAITRAMLIGQAITESTAIYALLIALLILVMGL
jgi:F-type H+-transporting ATPase subunit c